MKYSIELKNPVMVALDVSTVDHALSLADKVAPYAGAFKVGPRLVYRFGQELVATLAQKLPVFIDCKFHDIPSVVEAGVLATFESGASFVTIHASNGPECLKRLAKLENELNKKRPFQILGVTVLTSFSAETLPSPWRAQTIPRLVTELAEDCEEAGLTGLVCSAEELPLVSGKNLFCVVPGIRPEGAKTGDQTRVMTPQKALDLGANALVVGRPIIEAEDPADAAEKILFSISKRAN